MMRHVNVELNSAPEHLVFIALNLLVHVVLVPHVQIQTDQQQTMPFVVVVLLHVLNPMGSFVLKRVLRVAKFLELILQRRRPIQVVSKFQAGLP